MTNPFSNFQNLLISPEGICHLSKNSYFLVYLIQSPPTTSLSEEEISQLFQSLSKFLLIYPYKISFYSLPLPFDFSAPLTFLSSLHPTPPLQSLRQQLLATYQQFSFTKLTTYFLFLYAPSTEKLIHFLPNLQNTIPGKVISSPFLEEILTQLFPFFLSPQLHTSPIKPLPFLKFSPTFFQSQTQYHQISAALPSSSEVFPFWLQKLMQELAPACLTFLPLSPPETATFLNKALTNLEVNLDQEHLPSEIQQISHNQETLKDLASLIYEGQEKLFSCSLIFLSSASSLSLLKKQFLSHQEKITTFPATFLSFPLQQQEALSYFLPSENNLSLQQSFFLPSSTLAAAYPFLPSPILDPQGILLASFENAFLFFDPFHLSSSRTNHNMFILGTSGKGKSYLSKKLLSHLLLKETKIIILDPENEYHSLGQKYHALSFDLALTSLNPFFLLPDIAAQISFFEGFLPSLFPSLNPQYLPFLWHVFSSFLQKETSPSFVKFYNFLLSNPSFPPYLTPKTSSEALQHFLTIFHPFSNPSSMESKLFSSDSTTSFHSSNLFIFNLQSLLTLSPRIMQAQFFLLLKTWEHELIKSYQQRYQKLFFVIDEAHLLIDKHFPLPLLFLSQLTKRIRKYQGGVLFTTQNINDFIGDDSIKKYSTAIINNCQYSFYFQLKSHDLQLLSNSLSSSPLTPHEISLISSFSQGECLMTLHAKLRFPLKILP